MNDRKPKVVRRSVPQRTQSTPPADGAETLGGSLDLLNQRFAEVEARLQPYGVAAQVILPDYSDAEEHIVSLLSFEKQGNRWRLLFVIDDLYNERRLKEETLVSASRSVRLASAAVLPELVATVKANAAKEAEAVRGALNAVEAVLRTLPSSAAFMASDDDSDDIPF